MILKNLSLANFRGFDQIDLSFDSKRTVIAGVNGIGKSGILRAVSVALSRFLPQMTDCQEKVVSLTDDDIQSNKPQLHVSAIFGVAKQRFHLEGFRQQVDLNASVEYRTKLDDLRAKLADAKKDRKARPLQRLRREAERYLALVGEEPERWTVLLEHIGEDSVSDLSETEASAVLRTLKMLSAQPIAVYFSTSRYEKIRSRKLADPAPYEKKAAYYNAFDEEAKSFRYFLDWFRSQKELKGPGQKKRLALLTSMEAAAGEFVEGVKHFKIDYEPPKVRFLVEKKGVTLSLNQLSDGERGLLALVFDIARRLAIANPHSDNPIKEGLGIILIDEIELHLHPRWQRKVLRQLSNTFPKCQFIVTNHSPQVIGQSKPEQLRVLKQGTRKINVARVGQSFGMDSNWILEEIMGTPSRDHKIEVRLRSIADAIDESNFAHARELANQLEKDVGLFPDLQEWKSMLDRLEMLNSHETD